jgi:hypothetical protein
MAKLIRLSIVVAVALTLLIVGCVNKNGSNENQPPNFQAQTFRPPTDAPAAQGPAKGIASKLAPYSANQTGMAGYEATDDSCKNFCKNWCPKAARCKLSTMNNIAACKKLCFDPCKRGLVPKKLGLCLVKNDDCEKVRECFAKVRQAVVKKKQEAAGNNQPEQNAPETNPGPAGKK